MWRTTAGRHLSTEHATPGTVVRWPKSLTNRDSWPSDPEVFRRELTRPFSPALLLNLYRWDLKPLSSSAQRQKRRQTQRQGHVSNAVHPRAGLTGLAGGPGSPADAPRGKPPHDDASSAGSTLEIHMKYSCINYFHSGPYLAVFNGPCPDRCSCPALPNSARLCSAGT